MTIRVVLADDQPLVRTALEMVIADTPDIEVIGQAGTGAEVAELAGKLFLTKLDARDRVQLVIIAYDAGLVAPAR
jgi:DNA-binding NarL/FixJ family response regulator